MFFLLVTSKFLVVLLSIDHGAALRERPGLHDSGQESGWRALLRLRLGLFQAHGTRTSWWAEDSIHVRGSVVQALGSLRTNLGLLSRKKK